MCDFVLNRDEEIPTDDPIKNHEDIISILVMNMRQTKTKVKLTRKDEAEVVQDLSHDLIQNQDRDHDHNHDHVLVLILILLILYHLLNGNNLILQQHNHEELNKKKKVNFH
jgi:hypothetical protein